MRDTFYWEPPEFAVIIEGLAALESEINDSHVGRTCCPAAEMKSKADEKRTERGCVNDWMLKPNE
jgi:hypothetical protein